MRITFVAVKINLQRGGDSPGLLMKAKAMKELGHDVRIITTFSHLNDLSQDFIKPAYIIEENISSTGFFALQKFMVALLKKYTSTTDVFFFMGPTFDYAAGWYRLFAKGSKPVVLYYYGFTDYMYYTFMKKPLWDKNKIVEYRGNTYTFKHAIRFLIERTLGVFLVNHIDRICIFEPTIIPYYVRAGVRPDIFINIHDFHDLETYQSIPKGTRPFKSPEGGYDVLFVGRLVNLKGPDLLIRAFAELSVDRVSYLHIIGYGPMKERLEQEAKTLGIADRVFFYDWKKQQELMQFYRFATVFVFPSRHPGITSRTTGEALAMGVPLVVNNTCVYPWIQDVAKLFPLGDVHHLAKEISEACLDREFQKRAREKGPIYAEDNFSYRRQGKLLEQLFKDILGHA